jgi:hypothetical protein
MLFLRQLFAYLNTFEIRMSFLGNVGSVTQRENNAGTKGRDAKRCLRSFVSADLHNLKTFTFLVGIDQSRIEPYVIHATTR